MIIVIIVEIKTITIIIVLTIFLLEVVRHSRVVLSSHPVAVGFLFAAALHSSYRSIHDQSLLFCCCHACIELIFLAVLIIIILVFCVLILATFIVIHCLVVLIDLPP